MLRPENHYLFHRIYIDDGKECYLTMISQRASPKKRVLSNRHSERQIKSYLNYVKNRGTMPLWIRRKLR